MAILPLQLARVSNLLRSNIANQTISRTQQSLLEVQNQLSTGKRLNAPSDDPGTAAIVQQLQKTLQQRKGYADNLSHAGSQLGEVDATFGDITALLQQAQTIASANVGSDVTQDQRQGAATIVQSLNSQLLSLANKQFGGVYLFGGDQATQPPFVSEAGGVRFVGSSRPLENVYDEHTQLAFMVNGDAVFGARSTRVQGTADLTPGLSSDTRVTDLNGTTGHGVRLGSIRLGNGTTSTVVDLSHADTASDVVRAINAAGVGSISASLGASGGLQLSGGATDNITVEEVGGGTTASDLGILETGGAGSGIPLTGQSVAPRLILLTPLSSLRGGAGIDLSGGMIITNGQASATIDLSTAQTVEDLLNAINGAGIQVSASINAAGTGINIINPTQGPQMTIAENGGTTAADLGIRSFSPAAQLKDPQCRQGHRHRGWG